MSGEKVTIEKRLGGGSWKEVGRATPKNGLATVDVIFAGAGTVQVRARWAGYG
jgi:hypothetical protein